MKTLQFTEPKLTERGISQKKLIELAKHFCKREDDNSILLVKDIQVSPKFPSNCGLAEAYIISKIVRRMEFDPNDYFKTASEWRDYNNSQPDLDDLN